MAGLRVVNGINRTSTKPPETLPLRAFIAIELPTAMLRRLGTEIAKLQDLVGGRAIRWVDSEAIHLTLQFLGEIDDRTAELIAGCLDEVCANYARMSFEVGGLGGFPNLDRPRVIWIGIRQPDRSLSKLQSEIEGGVSKVGIDAEDRAYHPHLTLGRLRREASQSEERLLADRLSQIQIADLGSVQAEGVSLMRSELTGAGAVYSRLHFAALRTPN
jgi:2'-5' RNA ligase